MIQNHEQEQGDSKEVSEQGQLDVSDHLGLNQSLSLKVENEM